MRKRVLAGFLLVLSLVLAIAGAMGMQIVERTYARTIALRDRGEIVKAVLSDKKVVGEMEIRSYRTLEDRPREFTSEVRARGRAQGRGDVGSVYEILHDPQDPGNLRIMRKGPNVKAELEAMQTMQQLTWAFILFGVLMGGWGIARWRWAGRGFEGREW